MAWMLCLNKYKTIANEAAKNVIDVVDHLLMTMTE